MIYIRVCFILSTLVVVYRCYYYLLNIFQQEHYHANGFIKCLKSFYTQHLFIFILYLLTIISFINNIYLYPVGIFIVFISMFTKQKQIKKLVLTNRVKRLYITFSILIGIISFINILYPYVMPIYILVPFIILFVNIVNIPIEKIVNKRYLKSAKEKLLNNKNLIKIAITGSYGKTSTKNIVTSIIQNKYLTLKTPASFNTLMGLSKTINTSLNSSYEVAVFEMGASHLGNIKEMAKFIDPDIAIITDIGFQHIETFKTIENVTNTKFELIDYLDSNDIAILNGDNTYIRSKIIDNVNNVYYYGLEKTNNVYADNIIVVNGKTKFDVFYNNEFVTRLQTSLLGLHNIKNILASFLVYKVLIDKYGFDISIEEFTNEVNKLSQTKHRLSYSKVNNIHLYDDSYNANIIGFLSGIDVVSKTPYKKIIITPGIVDGGKITRELNEEAASKMKGVFDSIYIIESYSGKYIYDKLKAEENVLMFKSFKEAYNDVLNKYKNEEIVLLIENDLPDNYLQRRS